MDTLQLNKKKELINYYRSIKNFEKQQQMCLEVLKETPQDENILYNLACTYSELQQPNDCIKACFETLENAKVLRIKALTLNLLGDTYRYIFEYKKAEKYNKEAIEIEPNNAIYLSSYATTLAFLGKKTESDEFFSLADSLDPNNQFLLIDKHNIYWKLYNDMETEKVLLSKMLVLSSDPLRINVHLGNFNFKYKHYEEAYEFYLKALLINPNISKDLKDIIDYCKTMIDHSIFKKEMLHELDKDQRAKLLYYMDNREYDLAQKHCENILHNTNWSSICALYYKCIICFHIERYRGCIDSCLKLLGTKAEDYIFHFLGRAYFNLKNYEKSIDFLNKALIVLPRDLDTQVSFIRCLAELGRMDEALSFIENSINYIFKEIRILYCKFIILYKFGDCIEDELKALNDLKIASINNEDYLSWVYFFYALTYEKYEQSANALEYINKTIDNKLSYPDIEVAYKRIKKMNETGGQNGRIGIFGVFKRKKAGRQTYPLLAWQTIQRKEPF